METKIVDISDFSQTSSFNSYNTGTTIGYSTPTIEYISKYFSLAGIPAGASLVSATLRITRNQPNYFKTQWKYSIESDKGVNEVSLSPDITAYNNVKAKLAAAFNDGDRSILFRFKYQCAKTTKTTVGTWNSKLDYSNVRLTIEYEMPYTACTPPSDASVSPSVSEGDATLAFSGAGGGTSNAITGYEVQYAESADGTSWGAWQALKVEASSSGNGSFAAAPSGTRGTYRKYQMRTRGAAGSDYYSTWKAVSGTVRRNALPSAPEFEGAAAGCTIYNAKPRILLTVGADADEQTQIIIAEGYSPSTEGALEPGRKIVLRSEEAIRAPGEETVEISAEDALGVAAGEAASRTFNYALPAFTDTTLTAGTTPVKAAHMNELRVMVNTVRAFYGMEAVSWAETITAGATGLSGWKAHIEELRTAIDEVVSLVNGWDAETETHNISSPEWISIPTNKPAKAVMDQLRAVIPAL